MRLLWVVRSYAEASIFDEALHSMQTPQRSSSSSRSSSKSPGSSSSSSLQQNGPEFSYSLFVTNTLEGSSSSSSLDRLEAGVDTKLSPLPSSRSSSSRSSSKGSSKMNTGRPDLQTEIMALAPWGFEAVVFACGPMALQNACAEFAGRAKVDLRTESFEL